MRKKAFIGSLFLIVLLLVGGMFYTLPYYVTKPGMAKMLKPIVKVKNGYSEKGDFMLTTVRMGRANIYSLAEAKLSQFEEIYPADLILAKNETAEEYNVRQLYLMANSKQNAIDVAYHKAGFPVRYKYNGIYVLNVMPDMPAYGKLQAGDRIFKVDGHSFSSSTEFTAYIEKKLVGDQVNFTILRKKQTKNVKLTVQRFKDQPSKIGIGIALVDDKDILVKPDVNIKTDEIGGPSAGLMFSLEIYNQLTKDDLTKGYKIAGTGEIAPDGSVGPIGGIDQKIVAADNAGAEIFFAPNEHGSQKSNYRDAVKTATKIGTKMKIVPVDSFDEAVNYLKKLPEK